MLTMAINLAVFKDVLAPFGDVVSKSAARSFFPMSGNVLIEVEADEPGKAPKDPAGGVIGNGWATIYGTNMDSEVGYRFRVGQAETGKVSVPYHTLYDLIKLEKEGVAVLREEEDYRLRVELPTSRPSLKLDVAEEFPAVRRDAWGAGGHAVPTETVQWLLARVSHAVARDSIRPAMTGVLMTFEDGQVEAAASDGFRLAYATSLEAGDEPPQGSYLLSPTGVRLLRRWPSAEEMMLFSGPVGGVLIVKGANHYAATTLIDANYPSFKSVLPTTADIDLIVPQEEIELVTKRARIFANGERVPLMTISVVSGEDGRGRLDVNAAGAVGESQDDMTGDGSTADRDEIAVNVHYFLDAVGAVDTAALRFRCSAQKGMPIEILRHDPEAPELETWQSREVIMPMQTGR